MATYTKTVDPNGGANYASLNAWEAGEQTLYASGDIAIADCRRAGATKDTTAVTIAGWTSGVIPKIIVNVAHRHEGKWADQRGDGGYIYTIATTSAPIASSIVGTQVSYLQISTTRNSAGAHQGISTSIAGVFYVQSCIIRAYSTGGAQGKGITVAGIGEDARIYNTQFIDFNGTGIGVDNSFRISRIYNCTFINCGTSINHQGGTTTVKNCLFTGCAIDAAGSTGLSITYSATSNDNTKGVPAATGNRHSQTFTFVDAAGLDFHLDATDAGAKGYGTDLSADAFIPFSDDIDGQTRTGAWDIGADQYVAAGVTFNPSWAIGCNQILGGGYV